MVELSKIERVDPREIWQHEAKHFTPWLAENLSDLGEALGLHLELRGIEVQVGSYSLDILAHDMGGQAVIIENQLEPTDHDHLGKLLTYAAGHDAGTIVWIAKEFRDEHRAALDYLNGRTGEDTEFFGVVVEVWKIDDSRPAPYFNLVVTPNEWRKERVGKQGGGRTSERNEKYREFFQSLIDTLREKHGFRDRTAPRGNWFDTGSGSSKVQYWVEFAGSRREVRVQVYIDRDKEWNERLFDKLEERKETIEAKLGESLSWERLDDKKACRIAVYRPGTIDDDDEVLEEIQEWAIKGLLEFKRVFGPELKELASIVDELSE